MRVMKLERLKALDSLLMIVVSFLYSLDQHKYQLAHLYSNLILDGKNHFGKIKKFIF